MIILLFIVILLYSKSILFKKYNHLSKKLNEFEIRLNNNYSKFYIRHSENYFDFFKRLGKVFYITKEYNNNIIFTCCAVLRYISNIGNVWYLCDLKCDKKFRNRNITFYTFLSCIPYGVLLSNKFYAIEMSKHSNPSKIHKVLKLIRFIKITKFYIYSYNYNEINKNTKVVSTKKSKNIIDFETNLPINILHMNKNGRNILDSEKEYKILDFSLLEKNDVLFDTGYIISFNINSDFEWITTDTI